MAQCVPASFGVKLLMTNSCEKIVQYSLRSYRQNFSSTMVKHTVLFVIFVIVFVACGPSDLLREELTAVVDKVVDTGEFIGWVINPKVLIDFYSHLLCLYYLKILYLSYATFSVPPSGLPHTDDIVPTVGYVEEDRKADWLTANLAAILVPCVTVLCLGILALLLVRKLCCNCKTCLNSVHLVSHELCTTSLRLPNRPRVRQALYLRPVGRVKILGLVGTYGRGYI